MSLWEINKINIHEAVKDVYTSWYTLNHRKYWSGSWCFFSAREAKLYYGGCIMHEREFCHSLWFWNIHQPLFTLYYCSSNACDRVMVQLLSKLHIHVCILQIFLHSIFSWSSGADPTTENDSGHKAVVYVRSTSIKQLLVDGEHKVSDV